MLQRTRWLGTWACAALLAALAGTAQARGSVAVGGHVGGHGPAFGVRGGYHGGYHGGYRYGGYGYRGWEPAWGASWLFFGPPLLYPWVGQTVEVVPQTVVVTEPPPVAAGPSRADPVIYPRNSQSAQQTEADRQDCNRWATTQPAALADAAVFQRAVEACMDARGYTLR